MTAENQIEKADIKISITCPHCEEEYKEIKSESFKPASPVVSCPICSEKFEVPKVLIVPAKAMVADGN